MHLPLNDLKKASYPCRFVLAFLCITLLTGLGSIFLHELLNVVEWLTLGYTEIDGVSQLVSSISFRQFIAIIVTGCLAALIWYLLRVKKHQIISVNKQIRASDKASKKPNLIIHLTHIGLQVASVGAGSPIGKEGAPRELGALTAGRIADCFALSLKDRSLLIASAAAAGLAAIYQVPFASILFAFETLGLALSIGNLLTVGIMTILTTFVARCVISDSPLYQLATVKPMLNTYFLAIILGLILGPLAKSFCLSTQWVETHKVVNKSILWKLPLTFLILAGLALVFPEILGNGGALAQRVFDGMPISYAVPIVLVKIALVLLTLKNGAYGGTLTPSFSIGAVLGFILLSLLQLFWPDLASNDAMLIGSSIFLSVTMNAPLTGIALAVAFTGQSYDVLPPLCLAIALAFATNTYLIKQK